jgi:hypothetical protein
VLEGHADYCRLCPVKTDCATCEYRCPDIPSDLQLFWEMWLNCSTQFRTGFSGATSLDYSAVKIVFDTFGVELTPRYFNLLRALEIETLNFKPAASR